MMGVEGEAYDGGGGEAYDGVEGEAYDGDEDVLCFWVEHWRGGGAGEE